MNLNEFYVVECVDSLCFFLMKYLGILCEDEIVGLEGREVVFVSVFFVFNVIFIFYDNIVIMFFKGEFCI